MANGVAFSPTIALRSPEQKYFRSGQAPRTCFAERLHWQGISTAPLGRDRPLLRKRTGKAQLTHPARPQRTFAQNQEVSTLSSSVSTDDAVRITLSTEEAKRALRFTEVIDGETLCIVVEAVAIGSQAEEEGVRPGQRLLGLSDPIRTSEEWQVVPGTSLSRVKDAIRFRRPPEISFTLTASSVEDDGNWRKKGSRQKDEDPRENNEDVNGPRRASGLDSELLANVTGTAEEDRNDSGEVKSVAQQLEERQRSVQVQEDKERAKLKARMQKRRDYMERESSRNDFPFFALLLSFFILPAAIILGIAFSSGYLDTIAENYRR